MQPVIETQPDSALVALGLARLYDALRRLAPRMGLSLTAHSTLKRLDQLGPQRLSELHAAESVTQPAMTQLVTRLEKDGFAVRGGDPADRRAVLVSITEAGSALVEQRRVAYVEALDTVLSGLSEPDRAAIIAALPAMERLVAAVTAHATT